MNNEESMLKPFIDNYDRFKILGGQIPIEYITKDKQYIFKKTIVYFLRKANEFYDNVVKDSGTNPYDIKTLNIGKTKDGAFFMKIYGADNKTCILIHPKDADLISYKDERVYRISEDLFQKVFDEFQKQDVGQRIEKLHLPKRFVNSNPGFNPAEDIGTKHIANYVKYLNDYMFESAEVIEYFENEKPKRKYNMAKRTKEHTETERLNEVIDFADRYQMMIQFPCKKAIRFRSRSKDETKDIFTAIYEKDDNLIIICEPVSGESWTRYIILKNKNQTNDELIAIITEKLQLSPEELREDSNVIFTSHTTSETFGGNLAYALGDEDSKEEAMNASYSFRNSFKNASKR